MDVLKCMSQQFAFVGVALAFIGCAASGGSGRTAVPLRVGITPDYAPLIYKQDGKIVGLEADLAWRLGQELGRPIQFVKVRWENQLSDLIKGNTDIVMSGMSITRARKLRASFSEPYLRNGLMALFRSRDAGKYETVDDILKTREDVGVPSGTTAEVFVQQQLPNARVIELAGAELAPYELKRKRIDVFIHDGHSVAWLASENEGELSGLFSPLTEEYIAWAVRRTDTQLLEDVNAVLRRWKENGVLQASIRKWMPYAEKATYLGSAPPPSETSDR